MVRDIQNSSWFKKESSFWFKKALNLKRFEPFDSVTLVIAVITLPAPLIKSCPVSLLSSNDDNHMLTRPDVISSQDRQFGNKGRK